MSAAHERTFDDSEEVVVPRHPAPEVVPTPAGDDAAPPAAKGRLGRLALVLAVVAVEVAWLGVLGYAAWRLILLL